MTKQYLTFKISILLLAVTALYINQSIETIIEARNPVKIEKPFSNPYPPKLVA